MDTQGHAGSIKSPLFNEAHDELISLGEEKTIRSSDIRSGEMLRTLRGESDDDPVGSGQSSSITKASPPWLIVSC